MNKQGLVLALASAAVMPLVCAAPVGDVPTPAADAPHAPPSTGSSASWRPGRHSRGRPAFLRASPPAHLANVAAPRLAQRMLVGCSHRSPASTTVRRETVSRTEVDPAKTARSLTIWAMRFPLLVEGP